jgi:hypothetical protein
MMAHPQSLTPALLELTGLAPVRLRVASVMRRVLAGSPALKRAIRYPVRADETVRAAASFRVELRFVVK